MPMASNRGKSKTVAVWYDETGRYLGITLMLHVCNGNRLLRATAKSRQLGSAQNRRRLANLTRITGLARAKELGKFSAQ